MTIPAATTTQQDLSRRDSLKLLALLSASAALPTSLLASTTRLNIPILDWTDLPTPTEGFRVIADLNTGGNTLLATHKEQALLIDTKFASFGLAIRQDAQTFNNGNPDLALINTHHHGDHTGGNAFIIPDAKASYAQTNAADRIASQVEQSINEANTGADELIKNGASKKHISLAQRTAGLTDQITKESVTPKNLVDKKETIDHAGSPVTLHHFGAGHTDNDLVIHFENQNIIHTGDLVFNGLHPFFFPDHGANALGWLVALNQAYNLCDKDTQVIPGHGQPGDRTIIESQMNYLTELITHVQKEIQKGTPKEEVAEMEWDFMDGLGFERIRSRAINAVYDELK
ncbi:MAG: MBL fold metallo-hydrolase [Phycisphaerales bacterium]